MITHYLKVAVRNLLKYKTQTIISILGLAVGFACIALSVFWNHYENSYDSDFPNRDRIYRVCYNNNTTNTLTHYTPGPLASYLESTHPEIETAGCTRFFWISEPSINGIKLPKETAITGFGPKATDIFQFEWIEGNPDMATWKKNELAISEHIAQLTCNGASPIGQKLIDERGKEYNIVGVYKSWSTHSNFKFDIIVPIEIDEQWNASMYDTYIMLAPGVDAKKFIAKMQTDTIKASKWEQVYDIWIPLKEMRYKLPKITINVQMEDIQLFTIAAFMIAACALLNYLTLFISRLRNKGRTIALRTMCGSSNLQMVCLLMTEYMLLLLIALLVSMLFIEISMAAFMELAQITVSRADIYGACIILLLFVILFSAALSCLPILYFKRKTMTSQLQPTLSGRKKHFQPTSVCLQFIISILFVFCSTVMMKQLHFLINSNINIERKQIAWLSYGRFDNNMAIELLKQLPCITKIQLVDDPLFPTGYGSSHNTAFGWEGYTSEADEFSWQILQLNDSIARFYGLKMKEGPESFDLQPKELLINETFAKKMNVTNPIGMTICKHFIIKGIVYDYQSQAPTEKVEPIGFTNLGDRRKFIAFKYDGEFEDCKKAILNAFPENDQRYLYFKDGEQTYNDFLKSEHNLLKLLGIITVVSILIALFGIYALIVQSCERHRKEIAIRKVNGAQVKDILAMFFKQYMVQVLVASAIAFPIGYALMKRWLENYSRQTEISFWVFLAILASVVLLVTLCIGYRVWKAANENPAEVVKSE